MASSEWYLDQKKVSELKENFEKAGLPLEYRAKRIFEEKEFYVLESHYKFPDDHIFDTNINEKEGVWRQIDIEAFSDDSSEFELTFGEFKLILSPNFIAECKYSSNKSFFLFKSDDMYVTNFPLTILGTNILDPKLYDPDDKILFPEYFRSPIKSLNLQKYENIVEVDIDKQKYKDNNYNDQITYRAFEQLYNAINYNLSTSKLDFAVENYDQIIESNLYKKWISYLEKNGIQREDAISFENKILDSIALKFLKENFDLADIQNIYYMISFYFPVLIINEGAGLFEVILDEKNNIKDFKKIKYGLCKYCTRESYNHNSIYPDRLDIIICDVYYLNELIGSIVEGIQKLGRKLEEYLNERPYLLGYEFLFNPKLIDPNDYFSD